MSRVARRQQVDADQGAVQEVAVAAEVAAAGTLALRLPVRGFLRATWSQGPTSEPGGVA